MTAGLWRDEASSVYVASATSMREFFFRSIAIDKSPPLFNGLLALWGRAAGFGETSLAIFAVVAGAAALFAVALAASRLAGPWAGLFALFFLLDGDIVFWEFAQVRPYMLSIGAAAAFLASFVALDRRIEAGERFRRSAIALSASGVALAYSHYAGTVAVGSIALVSLTLLAAASSRRRAVWRTLFLCTVPAGVMFLFWLPAFLRHRRLGVVWPLGGAAKRALDTGESVSMMLPQFGPHGTLLSYLPAGLLVIASIFFWRPVLRQWRARTAPAVVIGSAFFGVLVVMGWSGGASRYLAISATDVAIAFAAAAVFLGRALREKGVRPSVVAALGLILAFGPVYGEAYRRAASRIGEYPPSKSGIRRIAAFPDFDRRALFIAVPSYFARTLWYYGVPEANLRGFPPMRAITDTEYTLAAPVWKDPGAVDRFLAETAAEIRRRGVRRVVLVWEGDPNPDVAGSIRAVVDGATRMFRLEREGSFSGYPESVRVRVFSPR